MQKKVFDYLLSHRELFEKIVYARGDPEKDRLGDPKENYQLQAKEITVPTEDKRNASFWHYDGAGKDRPTVVFYHGIGSHIGRKFRTNLLKLMEAAGINYVAVIPAGQERQAGEAGLEADQKNAEAINHYLIEKLKIPQEQLAGMGISMGGGRLSEGHKDAVADYKKALMYFSTFTSFVEQVAYMFPGLDPKYIAEKVKDNYNTLDLFNSGNIDAKTPVLVATSGRDDFIDNTHGAALAGSLAATAKEAGALFLKSIGFDAKKGTIDITGTYALAKVVRADGGVVYHQVFEDAKHTGFYLAEVLKNMAEVLDTALPEDVQSLMTKAFEDLEALKVHVFDPATGWAARAKKDSIERLEPEVMAVFKDKGLTARESRQLKKDVSDLLGQLCHRRLGDQDRQKLAYNLFRRLEATIMRDLESDIIDIQKQKFEDMRENEKRIERNELIAQNSDRFLPLPRANAAVLNRINEWVAREEQNRMSGDDAQRTL
ncbi:MAG: hypothetical protein H6908_00025 [Hyphomicrobiales bacterium]|nr:hypothetical protein [Hyphomicrobiales bacterium]